MATLVESVAAGTHNCVISPGRKNDILDFTVSKYNRLFPDLPAPTATEEQLLALGRSGAVMDATDDDAAGDNGCIPAGWTFFGQFIAHDITADRSAISHHASTERLTNFRTPRLDLEAVYSFGPTGSPYLYDLRDPDKFLLGINDRGRPDDVPRNSQGRALTGDPRNDVHLIISQMHLAFLKFHNATVDWLRERSLPKAEIFAEAQRLVRWHYQWIVLHEFLPLTAGSALMEGLRLNGPSFYRVGDLPSIPVEFADAAYRYGHSQIRAYYQLNERARGRVFPDCAGACPVPADRALDWRLFFAVDSENPPQPTRRIDARLTHSLISLPEAVVGETELPEYHSLAVRDLLRGKALDLPSGEAVARVVGVEPLSPAQLGLRSEVPGWEGETPLWYYVLREAEVLEQGERLGPVGGRIVGEVLLGLIDADPGSYRSVAPSWTPELPGRRADHFTFTDLLEFAGVV
ncbi:MAG: peroxidase [Chloroflexi bacterium]|nr:peroxidase [Chloroflexota bacterium]